jgi:ribosome recycling factor
MIDVKLIDGATKPFEQATAEEMTKSIKHFEHELVSLRTGRAHPSMVEDLKVQCYGGETTMPLKSLASVSTPEGRMIVIQPWDITVVPDIERAIKESDVGVTPQNDGNIIRLILPDMSISRREELKKVLSKKLEECRVGIRSVRKHYQNLVRDTQKAKEISEDFAKRLNDLLQKTTDKFIKQAEVLSSKKEADLKG